MDEFLKNDITLLDEEGIEHNFEVLDVIEDSSEKFYALLPKKPRRQESFYPDVCSYYIFKEIKQGEEQILVEVDEGTTLDRISKLFEKRFNDEA